MSLLFADISCVDIILQVKYLTKQNILLAIDSLAIGLVGISRQFNAK